MKTESCSSKADVPVVASSLRIPSQLLLLTLPVSRNPKARFFSPISLHCGSLLRISEHPLKGRDRLDVFVGAHLVPLNHTFGSRPVGIVDTVFKRLGRDAFQRQEFVADERGLVVWRGPSFLRAEGTG